MELSQIMSAEFGLTSQKVQSRSKFINEAGLFELIMKSGKPMAKTFQEWVTSTLLPSLKNNGSYRMDEAPSTVQAQMNVIHRVTNNGTPAPWYEEMTLQLAEANKKVLSAYETIANNAMQMVAMREESHKAINEKNFQLISAKDETLVAYRKIVEFRPLVVSVPEDKSKFHFLEVFNMGEINGKYCYRGIRAQKKNIAKLRPKQKDAILSIRSPNAMNAFNRVKDFVECTTKNNEIFCKLPPNEFLEKINQSLAF
jgi:prophage antirepressor-like protein